MEKFREARYFCRIRMRRILPLIAAVIVVATAFVAWTFSHLEGFHDAAWSLAPLALTLGFLPTTLRSRIRRGRWLRAANVASGIALGFLTFFIMAALASWAAIGASRALGRPVGAPATAAVLFGAAALVGLYALASAYWVRVTKVTVRLPHLPEHWNGRMIALVTDVHLGNFRGAAFSRRVVSKLNNIGAECVLIGGDLFDGVKIDVPAALKPWADLKAPAGVYFVGGNHDDYGGRTLYFGALLRLGIRVLDNERVVLGGLQLVGIHDRESNEPATYKDALRRAAINPNMASILLVHRPSLLGIAAEGGVSLQLSGHTHMGQFWPWTHIARRVHGKFAYGLNRFGRMLVYTSSGAGTWGPPFRLGSRSEVVQLRLEAA